MTWRDPNDLERFLLGDTRQRWPRLIPFARVLSLAPRIEPLLLRNARLRFLPRAGAEIESELWFSPLMSARSSREIVLHLGLARVLAGGLDGAKPWPGDDPAPDPEADPEPPPALADVWQFTREHTRHWTAEDRLERDLRYHALRDDDPAIDQGLRTILAEIARESGTGGDEERRVELARLVKRSLPAIRPSLAECSARTARLLARYGALALGDAGDWSSPAGAPDALPDWLQARLPRPRARSRLGIEVRWDQAHGQVLHLVNPADGQPAIELPSPLPARLHVAPADQAGRWHPIRVGTRIPIRPPSPVLRLSTLDGAQWDLVSESLPTEPAPTPTPRPLILVHAAADRAQAEAIARWLRAQGIAVDLLADAPPAKGRAPTPTPGRVLRLWTRAARDLWAHSGTEPSGDESGGLVLRTESVEPPGIGAAAGRLIDWLDWRRLADSPSATALAQAIERWWQAGEPPPTAGPAPGDRQPPEDLSPLATAAKEQLADEEQLAETERLLAEIAEIWPLLVEISNPKTEPPRRLEIGDRLAELGDPRPGVGTIEIEVPLDESTNEAPHGILDHPAQGRDRTDPEPGGEPQTPGRPFRDPFKDGSGQGPEMVRLPGGTFRMGDLQGTGRQKERPTHSVTLGEFAIGSCPVTFDEFDRFCNDTDREKPPFEYRERGSRPVINVSWHEANAYCRWLSDKTGERYRLLTEAEWEYACRAGSDTAYSFGDNPKDLRRYAWYRRNAGGAVHPVREKEPNAWMLYDMHGNLWEWVQDWMGDYSEVDLRDPVGPPSGTGKVFRGGSWNVEPPLCRSSSRQANDPTHRSRRVGFRVARAPSRNPTDELPQAVPGVGDRSGDGREGGEKQ